RSVRSAGAATARLPSAGPFSDRTAQGAGQPRGWHLRKHRRRGSVLKSHQNEGSSWAHPCRSREGRPSPEIGGECVAKVFSGRPRGATEEIDSYLAPISNEDSP